MTGIQFVTDEKGRRTAVLIDLKKGGWPTSAACGGNQLPVEKETGVPHFSLLRSGPPHSQRQGRVAHSSPFWLEWGRGVIRSFRFSLCAPRKFKSPAGQTGLGKMPVGTLPIKQLHYSKPTQVEKPCGGRRTRTVMADPATRLLDRQRPVPTGNVLQTQPIARSVLPSPWARAIPRK